MATNDLDVQAWNEGIRTGSQDGQTRMDGRTAYSPAKFKGLAVKKELFRGRKRGFKPIAKKRCIC